MVRRLARDRRARQRRLLQSSRLSRQRSVLQHQNSLQQLSQLETQRKQAKLSTIRQRQEKTALRQEKRKLEYARSEAEIKKVKAVKPLHATLEERFRRQYETPKRLHREHILSTRKQLRVPMNLPAIHTHAKSFDALLKQREVKNEASRALKFEEFRQKQAEAVYYRPKAAVFVEAERRKVQTEALERSVSARLKTVRAQQYGELVRALYPPKVSPVKALETIQRQRSASEVKIRKVGKPLLHPWKPTMKLRKKQHSSHSEPATPKPVFDYLRARRLRHEAEFLRSGGDTASSHWEDIWSDSSISSPTRRNEVHKVAQLLDSQAKRHEAMLGRLGPHWEHSIDAAATASQLYMDSIKAKLALLSDFNG